MGSRSLLFLLCLSCVMCHGGVIGIIPCGSRVGSSGKNKWKVDTNSSSIVNDGKLRRNRIAVVIKAVRYDDVRKLAEVNANRSKVLLRRCLVV